MHRESEKGPVAAEAESFVRIESSATSLEGLGEEADVRCVLPNLTSAVTGLK